MIGEGGYKVKLGNLILELITGVVDVDKNKKLTRSEKTKRITRLADTIKNKLHDDKRKKSANKIANSTYARYMSEVRKKITEKNWHHHSIDKELQRVAKKYPEYSSAILAIKKGDITSTRLAHKAVLESMTDDHVAYHDVKTIKLDHEIMRHLVIPSAKKIKLTIEREKSLEKKKTNTRVIEHSKIISLITNLLTVKTKNSAAGSMYSYSHLALGIALATGRRQIEVIKQGNFKKKSNNTVNFSGQAKRRGGADNTDQYEIYTLVPADMVLAAVKKLRTLPEIVSLNEFDDLSETERNLMINRRMSKNLNNRAKALIGEDYIFKDSRPIYARICFDLFFTTDKKWLNSDEDVFFRELLGHQDTKTQLAYKRFKIDYTEQTVIKHTVSRKQALQAISNTKEYERRESIRKIHDWLMVVINDDPGAVITQSRISRELGSGRGAIKDYLQLAGDALAIKHQPDSHEDNKSSIIKIPEKNHAEKKPIGKKPRMHSKRLNNSLWIATASHEGEVVAEHIDANRNAAMLEAYNQYISLTTD